MSETASVITTIAQAAAATAIPAEENERLEVTRGSDPYTGMFMFIPLPRKRREAVWELFTSECVFLVDHIMVLKHCFMEPLKKVQVEGYLMFAEPLELFGNIDELCYVSYTFCREFISLLLKDASQNDFGRTEVVGKALQRLSQLTRDGEVYHDYCLNYSKAINYLEKMRRNEDFCDFEKHCEQDARCHRLQLTDLLISPMHRCTKVPLLLNKIRKYTKHSDERIHLTEILEKLEESLQSLEVKMKWLKNYERVQEIHQRIIWPSITEMDPRIFIPEFLRSKLNQQPCERLLTSPKRQLIHEGPIMLIEANKSIDMQMFLFDDILLLTKVKKVARKKMSDPTNARLHNVDGTTYTVHKQPIALDRFTIHDIRPQEATGVEEPSNSYVSEESDTEANHLLNDLSLTNLNSNPQCQHISQNSTNDNQNKSNLFLSCITPVNALLKNGFVLVQISRFRQVIGAFTLQNTSESNKILWVTRLKEAQENYKSSVERSASISAVTALKQLDSFSGSMETEDVGRQSSGSIGQRIALVDDEEDLPESPRSPSTLTERRSDVSCSIDVRQSSHWMAAHMYAVGVPPIFRQTSQTSIRSGSFSSETGDRGSAQSPSNIIMRSGDFQDDTLPDTANKVSILKIQVKRDALLKSNPEEQTPTIPKYSTNTPRKGNPCQKSSSSASGTTDTSEESETKILVTSRRQDSDVNLSPRSRRLHRLLAIHEKSQSMDAIFI